MANHCVDIHNRTKCSGSRFQCILWIWIAFMCLCVVPIRVAAGDSNDVSIYPEGDSYVRVGEELTIYCIAGPNFNRSDIRITHSGKELPTFPYNDTTIKYTESPMEQVRNKIYYCKNKKTNFNRVKTVVVASPPKNVIDFKCISLNFEVLNCSWTSPDFIIFTKYKLTQVVGRDTKVKPCIPTQLEKTLLRYCYWNTTSQPRYRQQEEKFDFILEAHNVFGNNTQNFTIYHYSIVKPDPPMNLTNITVTPHAVLLRWQLPINVNDFLHGGVDHKIEYQIAKIDDKKFFRVVSTSDLLSKISISSKNVCNFNLTLPYAHMLYGVRVYIKPKAAKSDEFWSDFSRVLFYTSSEQPRRPPEMIAGAFDQNQFQTRRLLYVYWKQLEEYEEAGANFTYKIIVYRETSAPRTFWPDKNKSLGYLSLEDDSMEALHVQVQSYNEEGSSANSSYLYIPPEKETRSLRLTLFTKLAYENGTYELSWAGIHNIDNYTLFWCHHNTTNICSGRINFTVLNPNMNKHIINLPRDYRYQFAISANKGSSTSGMVWAKCDMSKDGIAMFDFPIRFIDHDAPETTSVKLKWSMDCTLKEGIINGYNVSYCPVIGTSVLCDNTFGSLAPYIINNPKQMEVTVTGLRPYTTYQFTMALNTTYGLKIIENATVRITTLEDAPTKPMNVKITKVNITSLDISWDPPQHLNGHISKITYVIYNYGNKMQEIKYEDNKEGRHSATSRRHMVLDALYPFTNYSLTLRSWNEGIDAKSEPTDSFFVRTKIGPPSKLERPRYEDNHLYWDPPYIPGGTVDLYQVRIVKDAIYETLLNISNTNTKVKSCEGGIQNETYQVRAVNYDEAQYHGALTDSSQVILDEEDEDNEVKIMAHFGDWSDKSIVHCTGRDNLYLLFIIMGILAVIGMGCAALKTYKKLRKMGDIKPEFPKGLFVPEKDVSKCPFTGLYPSEKDEKPMSDAILLLPNSKSTVSSPEIKDTDNNCGSSDHTDSTALSDASHGPIERQSSTSDDGSQSSLRLVVEPCKDDNTNLADQEEATSSSSGSSSSSDNSPYFGDNVFKKNVVTGYVQPVVSPATGYVQTVPTPFKAVPQKPVLQPTTSSYVMAGLPPAIFSLGGGTSQPQPPSGYVRAEDIHARSALQFPKLGASVFGSESLPTMPSLPTPTKQGADSSYIQLQSLDSLPSHKPNVRNTVPLKPPASSGYVSPGDAVINKHLNNIISGSQPEQSAILDPTMSLNAYCRFSWSTDPANDNLNSILASSPTTNPSKN